MTFEIRPFDEKDYPQIAALITQANPKNPITAEALRYQDDTRPPFCHFQRFVAVENGRVLGTSIFTQYADMYEPDAYWIKVCVSPTSRQLGIGSALFSKLIETITKPAFTLRTEIQEDNLSGIKFAETRGFTQFGHRWESRLDVASFSGSQLPDINAKLKLQQIEIASFTDLAADPDRDQKLYRLQTELDQDVPMLVPTTHVTFEQFSNQILNNPTLVLDGLVIAKDGDDYIGMSSLFEKDEHTLVVDITGTKKAYRRRGIATALKIYGIIFAQNAGYKTIIVHNDSANQGMIAINEKLGFVRSPALLQYAKTFKT